MYSIAKNLYFSADKLAYQEFYLFETDTTFTKFRIPGDSITGTYLVQQTGDYYYAELTFEEPTSSENADLQFSCGQETLQVKFDSDGRLVEDNSPCDGLVNFYQKVK